MNLLIKALHLFVLVLCLPLIPVGYVVAAANSAFNSGRVYFLEHFHTINKD